MTQERVSVDFDVELVGVWSPYSSAAVTRDQIAAYAAATGETDRRLLDGDLAPIVFGVVPSWQEVAAVFRTVAPAEHWHRVVHGEHRIESARPLRAGDVITTRTAVRSIRPVSSGTVVSVEALSTDAEQNLVVKQVSTGFYIGAHSTAAAGEPPVVRSSPQPSSEPTEVRIATDAGLPGRYASASGDLSPIHLDDAAAREIGLPGVILHGMCSLALAGRAIVEATGVDATSLRVLACRFSGVALPGDDLLVRVWPDAFTAQSPDGARVLSGGTFRTGQPGTSLTESEN